MHGITHWRELTAYYENSSVNLGKLLDDAMSGRDTIGALVVDDTGKIIEWQEVFVAADHEEPAYDTPRCPVDWTGLYAAVQEARQVEASLSDM